jgi:hypothetical protein
MPQMKDSFEDVLDDWRKVKQRRHLRFIDRKLDESEKLAAEPGAEWIDEEAFWSEKHLPPQELLFLS